MRHIKNTIPPTISLVLLLSLFSSCGIFSFQANRESTGRDRGVEVKPAFLLVGAMGEEATEGAVYSFLFNPLADTISHKGTFNTPSPSFMASTQDGTAIYIANELGEEATTTAALFQHKIGSLSMLNQSYTVGKKPTYVATQGDKVVTANSGDGSITLFHLGKNGLLGQADWRIQLGKEGLSHPNACYFTADGSALYVTDSGLNKVYCFGVHSGTPPLTIQQDETTLPPGVGPRHIVFDKKSRFAYINTEKRPSVYVYKRERGALKFIQEVETGSPSAGSGAHIAISPDGRFLYTSHCNVDDGISIFSIDDKSGKLQKIGILQTKRYPHYFAISPNGQFLAVACRDSNEVTIYTRERATGQLQPNPIRIEVQNPSSLLWISE